MFTEEYFTRAILIIAAGFAIFLINFLIVRRSDERGKMGLGLDGEEDYEDKKVDPDDVPDPVVTSETKDPSDANSQPSVKKSSGNI